MILTKNLNFLRCVYMFVCVCMQMGQKVMSKQINTREPMKGVLMSYTLSDLRIPLSYEVGLTPITAFGTGDTVTRTIQYSERKFS